jgi:hypothetical protein
MMAGRNGGNDWREGWQPGLAGNTAVRTQKSGKKIMELTTRVQQTRFIEIGFNMPDLVKSGSSTPIYHFSFFTFFGGAGESCNRVSQTRNYKFG